ncbi:MAG: transcription elongation factor GreAB [Opitutus sp.]|nr:transcription elongation factor GreAB [Opitutus sp.]
MKLSEIHLSSHDYEVFHLLLKSLERQAGAADKLRGEIARAIVCDAATLPRGTVGINSRVRLQDLGSGEIEEYVLTLPAGADPARQRLSVLAPIGTALLGYHEGDEVTWPTPGGERRFRILHVQPEPPAPAWPFSALSGAGRTG